VCFFFCPRKKKDIYSYYVYLLDFLRFFLLYCFFNDNFPRLFRIIHHSSSWFAFISTPILCILFIDYLYKMYLYLCKRIRFIMCRFLYRFDSSQSSLTLSLSHAKYTVFIFRPSKSYTVLNNCRRIYIFTLHSLSISPSDTFFSLIFFTKNRFLQFHPQSVGRLWSLSSQKCVYMNLKKKKSLKKSYDQPKFEKKMGYHTI